MIKLRMVEREAKVIKFLLSHPYSTSDEVYKGCGEMVLSKFKRFLIRHFTSSKTVWTVNRLKYRHFLRDANNE